MDNNKVDSERCRTARVVVQWWCSLIRPTECKNRLWFGVNDKFRFEAVGAFGTFGGQFFCWSLLIEKFEFVLFGFLWKWLVLWNCEWYFQIFSSSHFAVKLLMGLLKNNLPTDEYQGSSNLNHYERDVVSSFICALQLSISVSARQPSRERNVGVWVELFFVYRLCIIDLKILVLIQLNPRLRIMICSWSGTTNCITQFRLCWKIQPADWMKHNLITYCCRLGKQN